jgi:hypothetical protein
MAPWLEKSASNREAMAVSSPPAPVATRACCLRSVAERVSMRDWGHFNQANSRFTLKLASSEEFVGNFDQRRGPRHSPTRW